MINLKTTLDPFCSGILHVVWKNERYYISILSHVERVMINSPASQARQIRIGVLGKIIDE